MGGFHNPFGQTALLLPEFMIGSIVIWSGVLANIPDGWQACDGTNGTPDLRSRFVEGATGGGDERGTGGASNHTHTYTGNGHTHTAMPIPPFFVSGASPSLRIEAASESGTTNATAHRPPWYKLLYIQRMS